MEGEVRALESMVGADEGVLGVGCVGGGETRMAE